MDVCPNCRLVAIGFKGGLWGIWLESRVYGETFEGVKVEKESEEGIGFASAWVRVYMTDGERRDQITVRMGKLQKELAKAKSSHADPYRAVFTDDATQIKDEIRRLEEETRNLADYTVRGDVSCIRFSPQSSWLSVGSRGGELEIFSMKGMQSRSTQGRWFNTWSPILKEADGKDVVFDLHGGGNWGLRGGIRRVGACKGHGGGVHRMDWSANGRLIRSCTEVPYTTGPTHLASRCTTQTSQALTPWRRPPSQAK